MFDTITRTRRSLRDDVRDEVAAIDTARQFSLLGLNCRMLADIGLDCGRARHHVPLPVRPF